MPVPILMYHQVSPCTPSGFEKYVVHPRAFKAQMKCLRFLGYQAVGLDDLLTDGGEKDAPRRVAITFDDGFADCAQYAAPLLKENGFTATFYVVSGLAGGVSRWLESRGISLPIMGWPVVRQLEKAGFRFGAHTLTHPRLTDLSDAACVNELEGCRKMMEDQLGHEVRHLAYPFGNCDERVRAFAAEAGYRSGCTVRIGFATKEDDPLLLPRIPVNGTESLADFVSRLNSTLTAGDFVRNRIGKFRARGLRQEIAP